MPIKSPLFKQLATVSQWAVVLFIVIQAPGLLQWHLPLWLQSAAQRNQAILCSIIWITPFLWPRASSRQHARDSAGVILRQLAIATAATAVVLMAPAYVASMTSSRLVALTALAVTACMLVMNHCVARRRIRVVILAAASSAVIAWAAALSGEEVSSATTDTAFYMLKVRSKIAGETRFTGGALALAGDRAVLARADGTLLLIVATNDTLLSTSALPAVIPIQHSTMALRVTGLAIRDDRGSGQLFAAYDHWDSKQRCVATAVAQARFPWTTYPALDEIGPWREVYRTRPCVQIQTESNFIGEGGGRLKLLPNGNLLLTTGDRLPAGSETDAVRASPPFAQDPDADYGKVLILSDSLGRPREVFTRGHRNPQGLVVLADGGMYVTEHGPRGGDELNSLHKGSNYGWPFATFGTEYSSHAWPLADSPPPTTFTEPVFAWVPSIGVSDIIEIRSDCFSMWRGDLLIGSLRAMTLFRLRMRGERVVYVEPIPVQHRVRDLVELPNSCHLVLWTDDGKLLDVTATRKP